MHRIVPQKAVHEFPRTKIIKMQQNLGSQAKWSALIGTNYWYVFRVQNFNAIPDFNHSGLSHNWLKHHAYISSQAEYAVAQLELLADMCRGRSQLPIIHLEQSFPYATLLNLASNDKLPFCFKAACLGLVQVLVRLSIHLCTSNNAPAFKKISSAYFTLSVGIYTIFTAIPWLIAFFFQKYLLTNSIGTILGSISTFSERRRAKITGITMGAGGNALPGCTKVYGTSGTKSQTELSGCVSLSSLFHESDFVLCK